MLEKRVERLEQQFKELTSKSEMLGNQLNDLHIVIESILSNTTLFPQDKANVEEGKIKYLTDVNEQMFKQNIRLRQFIENCIETQTIPDHKGYYEALRGDE